MKVVKALVPAWLITFGVLISIHGASAEKPISLRIENLERWKSSKNATAVRQSLGAILAPRQNYPRSDESLRGVKSYFSLFKKPFLLLEVEPNDMGGFFALVVFKTYPKVLNLWIYEIDKNVFEVREVMPLRVSLNKIIMTELEDKRIDPFWLTSLPP